MDKALTVKQQVYHALVYLAEAYGAEKVTAERLKVYSELLVGELTPLELRASIKNIVFKCKYFPSVAEIVEIVRPSPDDQANNIAGKILESVSSFGSYQGKEAKEFLGPDWDVVIGYGGWALLCKLENKDLTSARAQLRDLAKACVRARTREGQLQNTRIEGQSELKKLNFGDIL